MRGILIFFVLVASTELQAKQCVQNFAGAEVLSMYHSRWQYLVQRFAVPEVIRREIQSKTDFEALHWAYREFDAHKNEVILFSDVIELAMWIHFSTDFLSIPETWVESFAFIDVMHGFSAEKKLLSEMLNPRIRDNSYPSFFFKDLSLSFLVHADADYLNAWAMKVGRRHIQSLLDAPLLFHTESMVSRYEEKAREILKSLLRHPNLN